MELLVECARPAPDAERLQRLAAAVTDWSTVLRAAWMHSVAPLVHWQLTRHCPEALPKPTAETLNAAFRMSALRHLAFGAELVRIAGWLDDAGILYIAYKGPSLASWVYEDAGLREFSDLDLVVHPEDRRRAVSVLVGKGCREKRAEGGAELRGNCEVVLQTPHGCDLDLHWAVTPPYFIPFDLRAAWARVKRIALPGGTVDTFSPEDLFAVLALHGARHCWASLAWICDVAYLLRVEVLDWRLVLADARTRRTMFVALLLAADVLGASVPQTVLDRARRDAQAARVAAQCKELLFAEHEDIAGQPVGAAMQLRMAATLHDKARYVLYRALLPNQEDADALSSRSTFLLAAARPWRVAGRLLCRSVGKRR